MPILSKMQICVNTTKTLVCTAKTSRFSTALLCPGFSGKTGGFCLFAAALAKEVFGIFNGKSSNFVESKKSETEDFSFKIVEFRRITKSEAEDFSFKIVEFRRMLI